MGLRKVLADLYGRPDEFLKRLRSELRLHHKTIYQLWQETTLDKSYVYRIFRGEQTPSLKTMIELDEAMGRLIDPDMETGPIVISHG